MKSGFVLEDAVDSFIAKGMFEMRRGTKAMDHDGGTDFLILMDGFRVAVGITLRDDITKSCNDGFKWGVYVRNHNLWSSYAPIHIEVVVAEPDAIDWDAALVRGLVMADSIACEWESQVDMRDWDTWRTAYRQVVLTATKRGVTIAYKDFSL